jgi:hypothetical protein
MTITIEQGITIEDGVLIGPPRIVKPGITHTITPSGNARISTTQVKFGTGSYTSNSLAGFVRVTPFSNFAFGTRDFTIEFWYYPTSITTNVSILGFRPQNGDGSFPSILASFGTTGTIALYSNASIRLVSAVNSITLNQWNAVALVRNSGNTRIYINGTQSGNTLVDSVNYQAGGFTIGANDFLQNGAFPVTGFLDEIRVSNVARYTTTYTPATGPFITDTNTLFLMHCDGANNSTTFTDSTSSL